MSHLRDLLRTGWGALLVVAIMILGSLVLWIGTPLLWLWIGSQVQGATDSVSLALASMFFGVVGTVWLMAVVLSKLSAVYRVNRVTRGELDPGHSVLESVLVVSAAVAIVVFVVWFFLFAGASPVPVGLSL